MVDSGKTPKSLKDALHRLAHAAIEGISNGIPTQISTAIAKMFDLKRLTTPWGAYRAFVLILATIFVVGMRFVPHDNAPIALVIFLAAISASRGDKK